MSNTAQPLSARAKKLLALVDLIGTAANTVIQEWEKEGDEKPIDNSKASPLPTFELYNARRTVVGACGGFIELVAEPQNRLLEVAAEYFESRALHIATEHRIADILAKADPAKGVHINDLGKAVGIHPQKLARIMRTLCSAHIFSEVQDNAFGNNSVSAKLVGNEPLRAYIVKLALDIYTASDKLPEILRDPVKGWSHDVRVTAFNEALKTPLSRWEWMEEGVKQPDGTIKPRPELAIFGLAMLGGGRVLGTPLSYDYPWGSLGSSLVVDVGGGVGGMSMDLAKKYPDLRFIVQDRAPVMQQAKGVWGKEFPEAIDSKRVYFDAAQFLRRNPVKGADVYIMRYILHDWEDERCVDILKRLQVCLGPHSRILIADQVMNTTVGCPELESRHRPCQPITAFMHVLHIARDLDMMTIINGEERTPAMLRDIAHNAGLEVTRIWECRGIVSWTELAFARSEVS